ncbi:MAG: hypothetical protein ACRD2L_07495, partial [Terriglobia bacterium]
DGVNRYAYSRGNPVRLVDPGGTLAGDPVDQIDRPEGASPPPPQTAEAEEARRRGREIADRAAAAAEQEEARESAPAQREAFALEGQRLNQERAEKIYKAVARLRPVAVDSEPEGVGDSWFKGAVEAAAETIASGVNSIRNWDPVENAKATFRDPIGHYLESNIATSTVESVSASFANVQETFQRANELDEAIASGDEKRIDAAAKALGNVHAQTLLDAFNAGFRYGSIKAKSSGGGRGGGATPAERRPWTVTKERTEQVVVHEDFGRFYKHESTGLWWSKDKAKHGGSEWKVYRETSRGLEWYRDADEYGDFIDAKHKGDVGMFIPWNKLNAGEF